MRCNGDGGGKEGVNRKCATSNAGLALLPQVCDLKAILQCGDLAIDPRIAQVIGECQDQDRTRVRGHRAAKQNMGKEAKLGLYVRKDTELFAIRKTKR